MSHNLTPRRLVELVAFIAFFMATGAGIGLLTNPGMDGWYDGLMKSSLTPPGWVFGVVWSTLYLLMAVSFWCLLGHRTHPNYPRARGLFLAQLLVNWGWSFAFFTLHLTLLSFLWVLVLIVMVTTTIRAMWPLTRPGALLLLPYLMWISFASYLSGCIWWLNA